VCQKPSSIQENGTNDQRRNNTAKNAPLICPTCKGECYTEKDIRTYQCKACGRQKQRGQFLAATVKNALKATQNTILVCLECAEREKKLIRLLTPKKGRKRAYLCTCRCPIHAERCAVYRKWPGHNVGLTPGDLKFLKFRLTHVKRFNL